MKVVDGKFGEKSEETPLVDKLALATSSLVTDLKTKGSFILITEDDEGLAQIATDMPMAEIFLMFDLMKWSLLSNPEQTTIH
jgi:hypothetical protein